MSAIKAEMILAGVILVIMCIGVAAVLSESPNDFTDSGVGCIDDCLEPLTIEEN